MLFHTHGLLGQNARNLIYIKGEQFLHSKKMADSKLGTKKFLGERGVKVPQTLGIIKSIKENTPGFIESLEPPFVVKPNNGYGGKGILIIDEKSQSGSFVTNDGQIFSPSALREHLNYILEGFFSLSGGRDRVLIEKKIILKKEIDLLGKYGLPDIRVISYNMVPVMAMMRIPTKESGGKANIHGGACAAGIDIGTGKITYISYKGKSIKSIPGIGDIRGIPLPHWDEVLHLVVKVQKTTGIKFLGCDIVLDELDGPLLLEMNIRPGLEIQNVNKAALRERLDRVEGISVTSIDKGVRLGRDLFSGDVEQKIAGISGKIVLGDKEYVKMFINEKEYQYLTHIRISKEESSISRTFAEDILKIESGKKRLRAECGIFSIRKTLRFIISDSQKENIILGKNALRGFLIDPYKYKKGENPQIPENENLDRSNLIIKKTQETQLQKIDQGLFKIDKKLLLLKFTTPNNIEEQKQIFIERRGDYVPEFTYNDLRVDLAQLESDLKEIEIPDIPYASIYARKKQEVYNKIQFLKAFQSQSYAAMQEYSEKLFGGIDAENLSRARDILDSRELLQEEEDYVSLEDIEVLINKFNHIYGINISLVQENRPARFTMKGDSLLIRPDAKIGKKEIRSIIAHEIEGHYLRRINGKLSRFQIMSRGGAAYLETDEGLAIYNQARFLGKHDRKYYSIYERYYFLSYAQKHSYKKFIEVLIDFYDQDYARVFNYMLRVKRGFTDPSKSGVFMKDAVYLNGYQKVQQYMDTGGSLEEIYLGKLSLFDIQIIKDSSIFSGNKRDVRIPFSA